MVFLAPISFRQKYFFSRIYRLFFAVAWVIGVVCPLYCQEINSFRTASSGFFNDLSIWEVFDGSTWGPALSFPTATNDIYIDQTHTLSLMGNQSVKSLFINAEAGAGQKLLLNGNSLEIFGILQAFDGPAPGIPSGTWNSINWIGNSIDSRLVFRGNSRTIVPRGAWSGFSIRSRYSIIFDPGDGVELTIEEPVKSMRFIIRSGTLIQEIDTTGPTPSCATLSFNSEDFFGLNEYGEFIIENGGTFISKCDEDILFRSASRSVALFEIMDGGEAIFEGSSPELEVVQYELDGKVTFASGTSPKSFVTKTFPTSNFPISLHDLELRSTQNLQLPSNLSVSGDLIQSSTGAFDFTSTSLSFVGNSDQTIFGFPLITLNLSLNKPSGEVSFDRDLQVLSQLEMIAGGLNLQQNALGINLLGTGGLQYSGGYWRDISTLNYFNLPTTMDATNFTLPFLDQFQGGIRKVQLLGSSPGGSLGLNFQEFSGADFDPQFNDSDGTPILYRLYSYFDFSGVSPSSLPIEMRISADELIVDNVDDLRIVGTGYAAPGNHLPGLDPVELWARRSMNFGELENTNFTVGSYRTLSVLPLNWLELSAENLGRYTQVEWKVSQEEDNGYFEIYRSTNGLVNWSKVGLVKSLGDTEEQRTYTFQDNTRQNRIPAYYQLKQIDFSGASSWSEVFRSDPLPSTELKIYPNPHFSGPLQILLPDDLDHSSAFVQVIGVASHSIYTAKLNLTELRDYLTTLAPGIYAFQIYSRDHSYFTRFLKK